MVVQTISINFHPNLSKIVLLKNKIFVFLAGDEPAVIGALKLLGLVAQHSFQFIHRISVFWFLQKYTFSINYKHKMHQSATICNPNCTNR